MGACRESRNTQRGATKTSIFKVTYAFEGIPPLYGTLFTPSPLHSLARRIFIPVFIHSCLY